MISPFKGYNAVKLEGVYDIETTANGNLIKIGYSDFDTDFVTYFDTFEEFVDFLVGKSTSIRLWAHNGWGFDHLFMVKYLAEVGELDIKSGIFETGKVQVLSVKLSGCLIVLADSFAIFQTSLKKVCDGFCNNYKKLSIDKSPEWLYDNAPDTFYEYLRNDVLALKEALQNFNKELNDLYAFGDLANTIGSTAMRIFRINLQRSIMTSSRSLDKYERRGYFGGLVDCLKVGIFKGVTGIDVNSMYPAQMIGRSFPVNYAGYWSYIYEELVLGLWHVRYDTTKISPIAWVYDCNTRKRSLNGEAILDNDSIDFINNTGGTCRVIKGYVYVDCSDSLFDYMNELYIIKKDGNVARKQTAKYILNSTYGKFGQSHERTRIGTLTRDELKEKILAGIAVHEYDFGSQQLYSWNDDALSTNTFCVIATLVTLRARLKLFKAILAINKLGGDVLYFDTDSIHFVGLDLSILEANLTIDKSELGAWSYVFKEAEAGYAGKKLYYYLTPDSDGKGITKAKGVSGFTHLDLIELIEQGRKKGQYTGCTSPSKVLFKGVPPGVFKQYDRVLVSKVVNSEGEK